jgi:hypothetical protein
MGDWDTPETRYDDAMIIAKFRNFTELGLPVPNIQRCIDTVMNLEQVRSIARLIDCVH